MSDTRTLIELSRVAKVAGRDVIIQDIIGPWESPNGMQFAAVKFRFEGFDYSYTRGSSSGTYHVMELPVEEKYGWDINDSYPINYSMAKAFEVGVDKSKQPILLIGKRGNANHLVSRDA